MGWIEELNEHLLAKGVRNRGLEERIRKEGLHSENLPSLPELVVEAMRLLDDGAEIDEIEDLLSSDVSLVAKMLRVVNSPWYSPVQDIRTVHRAIMMLGFRGLRSLLLIASVAEHMERDYSCYGHSQRGMGQHAIAVAAGTRALAQARDMDPVRQEELFVGGLLHDIGKMLLAPLLGADGDEIRRGRHELVEVERRLLGLDHAEAGTILAVEWRLSPLVQEVIRCHHGEDSEYPEDVAVVSLADACARRGGYGLIDGGEPVESPGPLLETLGIAESQWESDIAPELEVAMADAVDVLRNLAG